MAKTEQKPGQKTLRNFPDGLWLKIMGIIKGGKSKHRDIGPWLAEAASEKLEREQTE